MATDELVHLIDDDDAVRDSLGFLLKASGINAKTYASAGAFLEALPDPLVPGCIVTDIRMPGMDGLALQQELGRRGCDLPVIIMTGHGDVTLAVQAMKAGALDFIEKPFDDASLLAAVRRATGQHAARLRRQQEAGALQSRFAKLSPREREVLRGLVAGHPNKAIANQLGISARTVEVHRAMLMAKTGAGSLPELVRLSLAAGIA